MSKSLNNAIGIHEPPLEMYGKLMSISDEMMWRYYELLTDVQVADIEKMKRETHPMQAKKDLARRIVADFHGAEAATKAGDDWAKQFQKNEAPGEIEEVCVNLMEFLAAGEVSEPLELRLFRLKLDKLLVRVGLADSATDAIRKLKQRAVKVNGELQTGPIYLWSPNRELLLRVGRKIKKVIRTS
jgi:tyrosyl-tRNA synthetase